MSSADPYPQFPDADALSRAFFEEGIRHLEDARILHEARRYPAAIASSMKAAEFGVKAVIILGGAMGWWDKIFTTHTPLSHINNLAMFSHHIQAITAYSRTLVSDVKKMEGLSPAKPGGSFDISSEQNPEYPFLSYHPNPATNSGEFRLGKPSTHFAEADSRGYFNTAQDLLTAVVVQYPAVGSWGLVLPAPI